MVKEKFSSSSSCSWASFTRLSSSFLDYFEEKLLQLPEKLKERLFELVIFFNGDTEKADILLVVEIDLRESEFLGFKVILAYKSKVATLLPTSTTGILPATLVISLYHLATFL